MAVLHTTTDVAVLLDRARALVATQVTGKPAGAGLAARKPTGGI
ncbi:hypothetical protein AB0D14_26300 [Streptomyces sp. NPDC048484]